jgi:hypothetical protein
VHLISWTVCVVFMAQKAMKANVYQLKFLSIHFGRNCSIKSTQGLLLAQDDGPQPVHPDCPQRQDLLLTETDHQGQGPVL